MTAAPALAYARSMSDSVPPRIVVLDGHPLTSGLPGQPGPPGEPTWDGLAELGERSVYPRTPPHQVVERARGAAIVLTNKAILSAAAFQALPELRFVSVLATGTNVVDLKAAQRAGVVVSNVPGYATESVVGHVFALLLEVLRHVSAHDRAVHRGDWVRCPDFSFTVAPTTELAGKALAIIGMGAIGRRVAEVGHALGMRVVAAVQPSTSRIDLGPVPIEWLALDELVAAADVLSLHCPLTDATHQLVNAERLARMKPTAVLINTGRGPLVDEAALAAALHEKRIAGAGLDVLTAEPPEPTNPLLHAPRCVITPHVAWATREARQRLMRMTVDNVRAFLAGCPVNVVTPPAGSLNPTQPCRA
jgi:glycerate dehydrogenase